MTREEAIEIAKNFGNKYPWYEDSIRLLEALGLIKFEEKSKIHTIFQLDDNDGKAQWHTFKSADNSEHLNKIVLQYGVIRLEEWNEGLVLWVGGEIKWKSWENYYKKGDGVTIEYYDTRYVDKQRKAGIIK